MLRQLPKSPRQLSEACDQPQRVRHPTPQGIPLLLNGQCPSVLGIKAMKAHPTEVNLQDDACLLLAFIAKIPTHKKALLKSEAVSAVASATENHPDNTSIKKEAAAFMAAMFPSK